MKGSVGKGAAERGTKVKGGKKKKNLHTVLLGLKRLH